MTCALMLPPSHLIVIMMTVMTLFFFPFPLCFQVLMLADGNTEGFLYQRLPVLSTLVAQEGKATAYVCENFACALPVTCPQELRRLLLE